MTNSVWPLDLFAKELYHTEFYKEHENLEVNHHQELCKLLEIPVSEKNLLEQVKLLPSFYRVTGWPYRWPVQITKEDLYFAKQKAQSDLDLIHEFQTTGTLKSKVDFHVVLGYLWKAIAFNIEIPESKTLRQIIRLIDQNELNQGLLSCFDPYTDRCAASKTSIGRYLVSCYKLDAATGDLSAHEKIIGYTVNKKYATQPPEHRLHYLIGHNRIVESSAFLDDNERTLELHQTTASMVLQPITETIIEYLLVCYQILAKVYGVKFE